MKKKIIVKIAVLLLFLFFAWMALANPFNLLVRKSAHFSLKKFTAIKPGTTLEAAVAQLGAPIGVVHSRSSLGCPECSAYYFLGDPPRWLLSFNEAWLLVDAHGRIVAVTVNTEL
jgi:hypothetical protein